MMSGDQTIAYGLLSAAATFVAYGLGRMHERRLSGAHKRAIDAENVYLGAQFELKRIQFKLKRTGSTGDFNNLLQRLRELFDNNDELRELYPVNKQFSSQWLDKVVGVFWDDATKLRFRDDVRRLRAD